MKTGIVMEMQNGKAVVLRPDGAFIEQKACPGWEVGAVVALVPPKQTRAGLFKRLAAIAACLVLVAVLGFGGYRFLFETVSVISIDINPSVELELNRLGRVTALTAYNDDGSALLAGQDLKGRPYSEAVATLLQSEGMQPYLSANAVLEFSVYSQTDEQGLLAYLNGQSEAIRASHPQLQVHCSGVGYEVMEQAHAHGISPGKMRALLELQELDPTIDMDEYSHHSMSEIHRLIREHHGEGETQGQGFGGNTDGSHGSGSGGGNGHGSGGGNGHRGGNG